MMPVIGNGIDPVSKVDINTLMKKYNVKQMPNTALKEVRPDNFLVEVNGEQKELPFDYGFVRNQAKLFGLSFEKQGIDTLKIARSVHKGRQSNSLEALCGRYSIVNSSAHRAYHDALATAKLYQTLAHFYESFQPQLFLPAPLSVLSGAPGTSAGTGAADAPATPKQIGFLARLAAQKRLTVTWDAQKLTKSQASGLIEKILAGEQP